LIRIQIQILKIKFKSFYSVLIFKDRLFFIKQRAMGKLWNFAYKNVA